MRSVMRSVMRAQPARHLACLAALLLGGCVVDLGGGGNSPCPPDEAYFERRVWQPILSTACAGCHSADGAAKATQLVLIAGDAPDAMATNLETVARVARQSVDGESILLLRPTGRHPAGHGGGILFDVASPQYQALSEFVGRVTGQNAVCGDAAACTGDSPGPRALRRLSRAEYDNTVRDLFGIESSHGKSFAPDVVVEGFDNNARALTVSTLLADQLRQAAEAIASDAVAARPELTACGGADRDCAGAVVRDLGRRAFRRPVTDDDVTRYLAVYDVGAADGHAAGMELVIAAMLQSPSFLYRSELGTPRGDGSYALTPYEIASELSYFLWSSMPDDELFAAAEAGTLSTPEQIAAQARRLLASPRSRGAIDRFSTQWLLFDGVGFVPKDLEVFPELTADIRDAMAEESRRTIAEVVQRGGSFADLLVSSQIFANAALAEFYGLPGPVQVDVTGFGPIDTPGTRGGILTLGAMLMVNSKPDSSSPIHRGKLVRERLLCQTLPPPPPGLNAQPPGLDPSLTTRERYSQHSVDPDCAGCHRLMDPIGFAFEHFDGVGRWRDDESGLPIDDTGEILGSVSTDAPFQGVAELAQLLASSEEAQTCFARQWVRFAYGANEDDETRCLFETIEKQFTSGDLKIDELIVALTQTQHFRFRNAASISP